jgi:Lysozyme like domain
MASTPPVIPTLLLVAGGYTAWFAVRYWRDVDQKYPSGPVKALLTGKGLPAPVREGSAQDPTAAANSIGGLIGAAGAAGGNTIDQGSTSIGQSIVSGAGSTTPPPSGGTYSNAQLQQLWVSQGGDPKQASFAAGVAEAESSGNPYLPGSWNPDGGKNYGLWQLDTKGVGSGYPISELQDPVKSTQITIMATRNGTDWADWADSYTAVHGTHGA